MSIQLARIENACTKLKRPTAASEWPTIAQSVVSKEGSFADFLEAVLDTELQARAQRGREMLAQFASF